MSETPLPITVCIIAGNEASRIRRTLESVAGWVSEMVVATDDKVIDGTDKIAEACGAKVVCAPWKDHSTHRNFASANASQPWLMALDADEVVPPELRDEIISVFKSNRAALPEAFSLPRLTLFCGRWIRHGDWYPDRVVRLWRREAGQWEGTLHEKLVLRGRIAPLKENLLHFTNENFRQFLGKVDLVGTLFAQRCRDKNRGVRWIDFAFRPFWNFFRGYVIRLGFLDGWQGYFVAWLNAFSTVVRYAKARELQQQEKSRH